MEVPSVAGQNDNATGWICLEFLGVEPLTQADIKDTRNDSVNSILPCGMSFTPEGTLTLVK
jgi:hypothetical protein